VATMDQINFTPAFMSLGLGDSYYNYGYLVVAVNLSDLFGTGARPLMLLLGVTLPATATVGDFERFTRGARACGDKYGVPITGGDTKGGDRLYASGVALGYASRRRELFTRDGARRGDAVYLSGDIGSFNIGTHVLSNLLPVSEGERAFCEQAILMPRLPAKQSSFASTSGVARGGIDISDGLAGDLHRLCDSSNVGVTLEVDRIPIAQEARAIAKRFEFDPLAFVFNIGGDWQFLVTAPPEVEKDFHAAGLIRVGTITAPGNRSILIGNRKINLPTFSHSDFRFSSFGEEIAFGKAEWSRIGL